MTHLFCSSIYLNVIFTDLIDLYRKIICSLMKTKLMQTVNALTIELQLGVEGSSDYHFSKKSLKYYYFFFFKTRFKIFWWLILARFVSAQFVILRSATLSKTTSVKFQVWLHTGVINRQKSKSIKIVHNQVIFINC